MPKTNEKDAYFFSHDCNARNDPKILALRSVYGAEGYGVYFMLVEILREQPEYSSIKRMKRRIRLWEKQYAAGEVSREKIMESFTAWEAHAKHGDTKQLRREMRSRLLMALDRADEARRAAGIPAARPGPDERRTKRYGTVTFQSGKRQPGEAGGKQQAHQVHQAGQ